MPASGGNSSPGRAAPQHILAHGPRKHLLRKGASPLTLSRMLMRGINHTSVSHLVLSPRTGWAALGHNAGGLPGHPPQEGGTAAQARATHHHVVRIRNFSFKLKFSTLVVTLIYQKTQNKTKKSFKLKKKKETKGKHYVSIWQIQRIKS